jgi:ribosomal protein L35
MSGKSRGSITKRFKITKNKKLIHRLPGQNHLNAKESGNKKRAKRRSKRVETTTKMSRNFIKYRNV